MFFAFSEIFVTSRYWEVPSWYFWPMAINRIIIIMLSKLQIIKDDIFIYDNLTDETILREDMYQAIYASYTIDCGWYANDENGNFITYLIKNEDWENPVVKLIARNISEAKSSINVCKEYLDKIV